MIDCASSDYEFRVEGVLGTRFLAGAFAPEGRHRYDSTNRYRVDLSDSTAPLLRASEDDWKAAAVVPLVRKSIFIVYGGHPPEYAVFDGRQYSKSGTRWLYPYTASRLSPDSAWLVLQSETKVNSPLLDKHLKKNKIVFSASF